MIKLYREFEGITALAIPFINDKEFFPASIPWGSNGFEKCILYNKKYIQDQNIHNKKYFLISNEIIDFHQLMEYKKDGCVSLFFPKGFFIETKNIELLPQLFYLESADWDIAMQWIFQQVTLEYDLTEYKKCTTEYFDIVFNKKIDENLLINFLTKRYEKVYSILHIIGKINKGRFTIYYLDSWNPFYKYAMLKATYAYKDKFIVLYGISENESLKIDYNSGAETHEMSHILLYSLGYKVFLMREGFASFLTSQIPMGKENIKLMLKSSKSKIMYSPKPLIEPMFIKTEKQIKDQISYDLANSFILWLFYRFSMDQIFEAYTNLNYNNTNEENFRIFKDIFKLTLSEAEKLWRKDIMQLSGGI